MWVMLVSSPNLHPNPTPTPNQGMWVMLVSSPVLLINSSAASPLLAMADVLLLCGFLLGVVCEVHC